MAVRKRAVRAEKKKRRLLLSALFVLLLIAALAVVFYVNREPEIPVLDRPTDPSVTFVQRATEEIASVTVENDEGTYTLKQENGVVSMLGREDFVFSENMLTPLLDSAAYVYAVDVISSAQQVIAIRPGTKKSSSKFSERNTIPLITTSLPSYLSP